MKKVNQYISRLLLFLVAAGSPVMLFAGDDDFYDDDIYYSPSKAAERRAAERQRQDSIARSRNNNVYPEYSDAPTARATAQRAMAPARPLDIDEDTYNRRGNYNTSDSVSALREDDDFAYTRRIERYHNPEVVSGSKDEDLRYYYAASSQPTDINVYIVDSDPWASPWSWRYGLPSYMWGPYSPYYSPYWGYGPGWSLSFTPGWGWDFVWGWGNPWYGPAWYPGWGHGWCPGHAPGWGGPSHAWRPSTPGASRPHRPVYSGASGNRHPGQNGNSYRPGNTPSIAPNGTVRPGSRGRYKNNQTAPVQNGGNKYRPSSSDNNYNNSGSNGRRGRSN